MALKRLIMKLVGGTNDGGYVWLGGVQKIYSLLKTFQ